MQPRNAQEAEVEVPAEAGRHAIGHHDDVEEPSWPGMPAEAQHGADSAGAQQGFPEEGAMDPEALRRAMQRAMRGQGESSRPARPEAVLRGSLPTAEARGRTQTDNCSQVLLADNVFQTSVTSHSVAKVPVQG